MVLDVVRKTPEEIARAIADGVDAVKVSCPDCYRSYKDGGISFDSSVPVATATAVKSLLRKRGFSFQGDE